MSTLIAVRVPDDLVALIDAKGSKRSAVVIDALRAYLEQPSTRAAAVISSVRGIAGAPKIPAMIPNLSGILHNRPAHAANCHCLLCKPPKQ